MDSTGCRRSRASPGFLFAGCVMTRDVFKQFELRIENESGDINTQVFEDHGPELLVSIGQPETKTDTEIDAEEFYEPPMGRMLCLLPVQCKLFLRFLASGQKKIRLNEGRSTFTATRITEGIRLEIYSPTDQNEDDGHPDTASMQINGSEIAELQKTVSDFVSITTLAEAGYRRLWRIRLKLKKARKDIDRLEAAESALRIEMEKSGTIWRLGWGA